MRGPEDKWAPPSKVIQFPKREDDVTVAQLVRALADQIERKEINPSGIFIGTVQPNGSGDHQFAYMFTGLNELELLGVLAYFQSYFALD